MDVFRKMTAMLTGGMLVIQSCLPMLTGAEARIQGDVNADGKFSVADVVLLQKWLLAMPDVSLADWETADFDNDGVVDVFDLCLMKRVLLGTMNTDGRSMTLGDFLMLAQKSDELTWADFAPYQGQDIGTGRYEMRYALIDDDESDKIHVKEGAYLLVCGDSMEGVPDEILVVIDDGEAVESADIRSEEIQHNVQAILEWIKNSPENSEENQVTARQLGGYALEQLQNGTYTSETIIESEYALELMCRDMAEVFWNSPFNTLLFVDAHTVLLGFRQGFFTWYGYLITDGTVTYDLYDSVPVPHGYYEDDLVHINWVGDDLYYYYAY